jgi:hypothetical protein
VQQPDRHETRADAIDEKATLLANATARSETMPLMQNVVTTRPKAKYPTTSQSLMVSLRAPTEIYRNPRDMHRILRTRSRPDARFSASVSARRPGNGGLHDGLYAVLAELASHFAACGKDVSSPRARKSRAIAGNRLPVLRQTAQASDWTKGPS